MAEDTKSAETVGWSELRALPAGPALAELLGSRPPASLDPGELVDAMAAAKRLTIFYEALGLELADEIRCRFEVDYPPELADDPHDVESWEAFKRAKAEVAAAICETRHRTGARLHMVRQLKTRLAAIWALVTAGRLDVFHAYNVIAEELAVVEDPSLITQIVDALVAALLESTPADATRGDGTGLIGIHPNATRKLVRNLVAAAQPKVGEKKFKRAYAERRVCTGPGHTQGMGELWMSHGIDRVEAINHRLGLLARALPADDERSMDQRMADLAADILEGRLVADTCTSLLEEGENPRFRPGALRRRPHINITVPIQTLMGVSDAPGQTLTGDVVPASLARQLAAEPESVWYRMLTDAGRFVELSTDAYTPTAALRRSVVARDRECVGVGCSRPADTCDIDHTRAHRQGGRTAESNLGPACRGDHGFKDNHGGFVLRQDAPGAFTWTFPSGHTYTTQGSLNPEASWPDERAGDAYAGLAAFLPKTGIPPSATDITEGLRLLDAKRRRDAAAADARRQVDIAEEKLRFWRKYFGDDIVDPYEDVDEGHGPLPVEVLEEMLA